MADEDILKLLEGQELNVKHLALQLGQSTTSLYKPLRRLVRDGMIRKSERFIKRRLTAFYSIPRGAEECRWQQFKEMLATGKLYSNEILDVDFWPILKEDLANLRSRKESLDILITGLKGVGKSVAAIWLATRLDPSFSIAENVILRKQQLLELAFQQPSNKSLVLDDLGTSLSSRAWAEQEREAIFSFFEICRQNKIDLLATSPSLDLVDLNFRRLVRYVWDVQLRCRTHTHIVVHRSITGLKPVFRPIGAMILPYPTELDPLLKEYERAKRWQLRGSAKDILESVEQAKERLRNYVFTHIITGRLNEDHFQAGLIAIGLDGTISKHDRTILRSAMFTALEEKQHLEREAKKTQTETDKATVKISKQQSALSKQQSAYTKKFQGYLDQGKDEAFAKTLAQRETQKKMNPDHWKKVSSAAKALKKKGTESSLIDRFILRYIDDPYLVVALNQRSEILDTFKGFPKDFTTKLWVMIDTDPMKAKKFIDEVLALKDSFLYKDKKGKFSPKKWQESVLARLNLLEAGERRKQAEQERERAEEERFERIAHHVANVGKFFGGLFGE